MKQPVVKFPTQAQVKCGPLRRGRECGCAIFHARRIDGLDGPVELHIRSMFPGKKWRCSVLPPWVEPTPSNNKKLRNHLRQAVLAAGYKIKRDRTIVRGEA
jgi:hypothetical protein